MKTILSGNKFAKTHLTYIKDAKKVLTKLAKHDDVKKVMLGEINSTNPSKDVRVKLRDVSGNLVTLLVRGSSETQVVRFVVRGGERRLEGVLRDIGLEW